MSPTACAIADLLALQYPARRFALRRLGLRPLPATPGSVPRLRGRGMTFDEHRSYQPGDEPRFIDWRVTARTGEMHVKLFKEEHEQPVYLILDRRSNMQFGSQRQFKSVLATQALSLLGWTAAHSRERLGGIVWDHSLHDCKPRLGAPGLLPWMRHACTAQLAQQTDAQTSWSQLAQHTRRSLGPGAIVVVASDFHGLDQDGIRSWTEAMRAHQLIVLPITDPLESQPPVRGQFPIQQGQDIVWLDFAKDGAAWRAHYAQQEQAWRALARSARALVLPLSTKDTALAQLAPHLVASP
jgi:uncharacterized protein (DUF58 family)